MPFWAAELNNEGLSQGDVVDVAVVCTSPHPPVSLKRQQLKGGKSGWREVSDWGAAVVDCLARGRRGPVIVLSHDCELDKPHKKSIALVAPVLPADSVNDDVRSQIMEGRRFSFLPLPAVPTLGDSYADLRMMTYVRRDALATRLASIGADGKAELRKRVYAFFFRGDL